MCQISNKNYFLHNSSVQNYRKIECPYPRGIIFRRQHLWTKEKYLSPYQFENKKANSNSDYSLWW